MNKFLINKELHQAEYQYRLRQLEDALFLTHQALEEATLQSDEFQQAAAHLLLARIYNTQGKYQANTELLQQALFHIQQSEKLFHKDNALSVTWVNLTYGKIHQNLKSLEQALSYFQTALYKAHEGADDSDIVHALLANCNYYLSVNQFKEAQQFAEECQDVLNSSENIKDKTLFFAEVYNLLGRINYKMAMQYLLEALELSDAIQYRERMAHCLINIGSVYAHLFNYEDALDKYHNALNNFSDVLTDSTQIGLYNNIGNLYYVQQKNEEAEKHFLKALELSKATNYKEMIAHALTQLGRVYTAQNNLEKALSTAQESQQLLEALGDVNGKQINLINLGDIYFRLKDFDKAIKYTSKGITASTMLKDNDSEIEAYMIMANIHRERKDFEQAYKFQSIYTTFQQEFSKVQRNRQILDMDIKYTIQEKQKEIEQLTKENKYQAILLEQRDKIVQKNQQLKEANEELKQFAYVTSHDLKEPLRMIGSYSEIIHKKYNDQLDQNAKEYFGYVSEGVVRMNNLLNDLLKYATIGSSGKDFVPVKIVDVVDISLMNLKVLIEETGAEIHTDNLPVIDAIPSLLHQLFQNLIGNAIKFRKPTIKPKIRIEGTETDQHHVISIKDNGIGIAEAYQEKIFIIFQRLHNRKDYEGTGIGLSICMKIMKRLGGNIQVKSAEGQGATFILSFPKKLESEKSTNKNRLTVSDSQAI